MHMLSFETIANLISLAVIASLAGVYLYGRKKFEPAAKGRDAGGVGGGNPEVSSEVSVIRGSSDR